MTTKKLEEIIENTTAEILCPECQEPIWDVSTVDQALNKCWNCGVRFLNDIEEVA